MSRVPMKVFADRLLVDAGEVIDLATGECVRLSVERGPDRLQIHARMAICDALAAVRHPLLLPIVDYGMAGDLWFEAHARQPALKTSAARAGAATRHLVRFLRALGVEPSAADLRRNVRSVIEASSGSWRPIGVTLRWRAAIETVMTVLDSPGDAGVTRFAIHGVEGSGLRTARLQIARAARQAGFLVIDRRFGRWPGGAAEDRHLCVLDWLPESAALPPILANAGLLASRRHLWIRFLRHAPTDGVAIALGALSAPELTTMIYRDQESGPRPDELRDAVRAAHGLPGVLVKTLTAATHAGTAAAWVHEAAPEYRIDRRAPVYTTERTLTANPTRIERVARVIAAAEALANRGRHARAERLLARVASALDRRGAHEMAARARCDLGNLQYSRARPDAALATFDRVGSDRATEPHAARAMLGSARALFDLGRLAETQAILRSLLAGSLRPDVANDARVLLVEAALVKEDDDAAAAALGGLPAEEARGQVLAARLARRRGDLCGAARFAAAALDRTRGDPGRAAVTCEAEIERMHVFAASGALESMRASRAAASRAARQARRPVLALIVAAEACRCERTYGDDRTRCDRLVAISRRLPLLRGAQVRAAIVGSADEIRRIAGGPVRPVHSGLNAADPTLAELERMLALVHEARDDAAAVEQVATHLLDRLGACSVVIRGRTRILAHAGRAWPEEGRLAQTVIEGGAGVVGDGAAPDVAEPVRASDTTIGCVLARWAACRTPSTGSRALVRVAAAALVPPVTLLNAPPRESGASPAPDDLLGPGAEADHVRALIRRAALAPYPVLIEGESGSGKELVARAIHHRSNRRARRFCGVNCAALTDELLEAELFGHARGAFTGALGERPGLFEEADQGTLLLDEVADLSPRAQAKVLRALQEGEVRRVGETVARRIDTRIVAATNRRLEGEVAAGRFRDDLRFRLDVVRIVVPPLRERPDAVPWLAERFWAEASSRVGTRAVLSPELLAALGRYDWPGNVRELQNVLARVAVHAPPRGRVPASVLPSHVARLAGGVAVTFDEARLDFERRFVRAALARAGGRKGMAAAQLGVSRQGLAKMLKRLGIGEVIASAR